MNVELTYTENLVSAELNPGSFACEVWASSDLSSAESSHRVPIIVGWGLPVVLCHCGMLLSAHATPSRQSLWFSSSY